MNDKIEDYEVKVMLLAKISSRNSMASDALGVSLNLVYPSKRAGGSNPPLASHAHRIIKGEGKFE